MSALVQALAAQLDPNKILLNHAVNAVVMTEKGVEVRTENNHFIGDNILLAIPPRLAAQLTFMPNLPQQIAQRWANTATWMAPHSKFIAQYARPFWRDSGLSGNARSQVGPMVEIHDISDETGSFGALFGFIGVPFVGRKQIGEESLKQLCQAQLVRLFGEQAATPTAVYLKDWATDPFTATVADQNADHQHPNPPTARVTGDWQGKLVGISSEFSPNFAGYLAGAVESASIGVQAV